MRLRPERIAAYSAFAALALGAAGTLFERASPSVLSAEPAEFASWARAHSNALLAQSAFFGLSTAPLLLFFAGLSTVLHRRSTQPPPTGIDLSLVVLGGGSAWVVLQLAAQEIQVSMASAAGHGAADELVASLGDLMHTPLRWADLALAVSLLAVAATGVRDRSLPGWLVGLSAATGGLQLFPALVGKLQRRPRGADQALAYLPYPVFVAWLASTAVALLRADARRRARVSGVALTG